MTGPPRRGRSVPNEDRLYAEAILRTMGQALVVLTGELRVETANDAFYRTFRTDPAETEGRLLHELGDGQWNIPQLRRLLQETLPGNDVVQDFKVEHDFEGLGRRVIVLNASRMKRRGRPDRILLAIDDITERERMIGELEGRKEYAEKIVDASHDAVLVLDWDLRVKTANATFCRLFAVGSGEIEGRMIWELGTGQWDIPELRRLLQDVLPHDDRFDDFELEQDFERIGRRILVLNGRRLDHTQLILLTIDDQTEGRRAERELRASEARLAALMEHAPVGIGLVDPEGRWVLQNAQLERWSTGLVPWRDPEQRARWRPLGPEVDAQKPESWPTARALRGERVPPQCEFLVDVEGGQRCLSVSAAPVPVEGEGTYAVAIVEDMTDRRRAEDERAVLLGELNHRVKNIFAVIRSLAMQSRGTRTSEEYQAVFVGRLDALVTAHQLVLENRWRSVDLDTLVRRVLAPFATGSPAPVEIRGEPVELDARRALSFGLALHELATNAAKHGALAVAAGGVRVAWHVVSTPKGDERRVRLAWEERGGPPVARPQQQSFGTRLIERAIDYDLQGEVTFEFRAEGLRVEASFQVA